MKRKLSRHPEMFDMRDPRGGLVPEAVMDTWPLCRCGQEHMPPEAARLEMTNVETGAKQNHYRDEECQTGAAITESKAKAHR